MRKSPITCKDLSRLASEAMDRDLNLWERISIKMHLWVCETCRRYVQHLKFLRRAASQAGEVAAPPSALSDAAKERMKKALNGQ